jgi:hypothetical protein
LWVAVIVAAAVGGAAAWSQLSPSNQAESYRAPRTAHGAPDLNGIWQTLNTANFDIQAHPARPSLAIIPASPREGVAGLVRATRVDVPAPALRSLGAAGGVPAGAGVVEGNEIPYQPWALAKKQENADNWLERDPEIKCFMPGVPRATYMPYPFQILQGTDKILIAYEFAGTTRTIHMDPVPDSPSPSWMGWSRGRWEGDTLVVETTNFNGRNPVGGGRGGGAASSEHVKVTERFTRISDDQIEYRYTIDDPHTWTRPWTALNYLQKTNGPIFEFACHESNYGVANILAGARAEEQREKK